MASVTLSAGHLVDLYRGETLKIRLRNVAGEEQILELRSAMVDERSKNANVMKQYDALLAKLDALLNQPLKGGNGSGKRG